MTNHTISPKPTTVDSSMIVKIDPTLEKLDCIIELLTTIKLNQIEIYKKLDRMI